MVTSDETFRIAIVGASVRAAAQSARRMGFDVVGADLFADADLDGICSITKIEDYPHGFADWLAAQEVKAWMYTGALENYPDLVDQMAAIKPLWGVSGVALRRCRDPLVLQEVFAEAGVSFPETLPLGVEPTDDGQWLAKTYRNSSGSGVWPYGAHPPTTPVYAQRLVRGSAFSAIFSIAGGKTALLGMTEQIVGDPRVNAPQWGYCGSVGPIQPNAVQQELLDLIGKTLVDPLSLKGVISVDLIVHGDSLTPVEINPRYTASVEILERCTLSLMACWVYEQSPLISFLRGTDWSFSYDRCDAKLILFARGDVTISGDFIEWLEELRQTNSAADLPTVGDFVPKGRPICTFLRGAMGRQAAWESVLQLVAEAQRRLYGERDGE